MFYLVYGPVEGRQNDGMLYSRFGMDGMLEETVLVDGTQYYIYGTVDKTPLSTWRSHFRDLR